MSDIAALLTWTNIRFLLEGLGLTLVISAPVSYTHLTLPTILLV